MRRRCPQAIQCTFRRLGQFDEPLKVLAQIRMLRQFADFVTLQFEPIGDGGNVGFQRCLQLVGEISA